MAKLTVSLLGRPQISLDGTLLLDLKSRKARALLFYLILTGRPHQRKALAGLFWGELPEEKASRNLRGELKRLRTFVGDHLIIGRFEVAFDTGSDHELDVVRYRENLRRPRPTLQQLEEAVELYRDDFLTDFFIPDALEFENWIQLQREQYRQMAMDALYRLAVHYTQQRRFDVGIDYARRLLRLEPWMEEAHRQLMLLLALDGQRSAALAQYKACAKILEEEFGSEPSQETEELHAQILAEDVTQDELIATIIPFVPPFQAPPVPRHFVGRESEIRTLITDMTQTDNGTTVFALVGMAGVGKTTLAAYIAQSLKEDFPDGVLWAKVASKGLHSLGREGSGIPSRLYQQLRSALLDCGPFDTDRELRAIFVDERLRPWQRRLPQANNPTGRVEMAIDFLYDRHNNGGENALVLLMQVLKERLDPGDDCHHRLAELLATDGETADVIDGWAKAYGHDFSGLRNLDHRAAALRGILAEKKVLIVLDDVVEAEMIRPMLPGNNQCAILLTTRNLELAHALDAQVLPLEVLPLADSRELMTKILGPRVEAEPEPTNEICTLLHNLPLAIEITAQLLASRPRQRLASMARRLQVVSNRLDLQISDRAVRASFTVSWQALNPDLRRAFSCLAVFNGYPFTAEAMAYLARLDIDTAEDCLFRLTSLSLIAEEGDVRYQQHPLLADFARERLEDAPEIYVRMAEYYLAFARQNQENYDALRPEWGNIMEGMRIAYSHQQWRLVMAYADHLTDAWAARGRYDDARLAFGWAFEAANTLSDIHAAPGYLLQHGKACLEQSDYDEAAELLRQSLTLYRESYDRPGIADALYHLARAATQQTNYSRAQEYLAECKETRQQLQDEIGVAAVLYRQARVLSRQHALAEAEALCQQALAIQEGADDKAGLLQTLRLLARIAILQRDLSTAEAYCLRSLDLSRELRRQNERATTLYTLSVINNWQGELDKAQKQFEESKALFERMGNRKMQGLTLYALSGIEDRRGKHEAALALNEQSLPHLRAIDDKFNLVYALQHRGQLYLDLGQTAAARAAGEEALQLAAEIGHAEIDNLRTLLSQTE